MDCIKNLLLLLVISITSCSEVYAWDKSKSIGSPDLDSSAIFQVNTTSKGAIACPQMSLSERDLISSPATGLCIFNTTTQSLETYSGSSWKLSSQMQLWKTSTVYEIGNIVHESNKIYKALTAHTSGVFATDLTSNEWEELSDDLNRESNGTVVDNSISRWDGTTGDNVQNSLVGISDGGEIISNVGGTQANADLNSSLIVEMSDATNAKLKYDSTTTSRFSIGEVGSEKEIATISDSQSITNKEYGNTASIDANLIFDMVSTTKASRPCNQMTEAQRDLLTAVSGSCIYNTDQKKLNLFDGATWVSAGGGLDLWVTLFDYKINDIVHESNKIYKALTNHTSGTFATDLAANDWIELSDDLNRELTGSVVDNAITRWDGTTGDNVENSLVIIDDLGNMTGINDLTIGGSLIGSGGFSGDILDLAHVVTPSNPSVGRDKLYFKNDDKLYKLDAAGLEQEVGASVSFVNDNRLLRSDIVGASSIQESGISIDDVDNMSGVNDVAANGVIKALTPDAVNFKEAGDKYKGEENYFLRGQSDYGLAADWVGANLTQDTTASNFITGENSVWKWTDIATISNQLVSQIIDIPKGMRQSDIGYQFRYKYDGDDSDLDVLVQCVDDSAFLVSDGEHKLEAYTTASGSAFVTGEFAPSGCAQVKVIFKVAIANPGKELFFDSVKVTPFNPTIKKIIETQYSSSAYGTALVSGTASNLRFGAITSDNENIIAITDDGTNTIFTAKRDCIINMTVTAVLGINANNILYFTVNGVDDEAKGTPSSTDYDQIAYIKKLKKGDYVKVRSLAALRLTFGNFRLKAIADTDTIVRMTDPDSVDSMVRLYTESGTGVTITNGRRFSVVAENIGNAVTYEDSAANGAMFKINSNGIYNISAQLQRTAAGYCEVMLTRNATANIASGGDSDIVLAADSIASAAFDINAGMAATSIYLEKEDWVGVQKNISSGDCLLRNFSISKAKVSPHVSIPIDDDWVNTFSASVIAGTGTVTSMNAESLNWLSSIVITATGLYDINIRPGVFTEVPTGVANAQSSSAGWCAYDYTTSTVTVLKIKCHFHRPGILYTPQSILGSFVISRQKSDFKKKTGVVTGKFAATRTCIIEDRKTVNGGSSSALTVHVRTLNTSSGDCEFLTLDNGTTGIDGTANQFILKKGKYEIGCKAPAYKSDEHTLFIYNATDVVTEKTGLSAQTGNAESVQIFSTVDHIFTINEAKAFQLRHYVRSAKATNGLGALTNTFGGNPATYTAYSQCKIQKVR